MPVIYSRRRDRRIVFQDQPRQKVTEIISQKQAKCKLHACNPRDSGGRDRRFMI
jgi:hypothetical protein